MSTPNEGRSRRPAYLILAPLLAGAAVTLGVFGLSEWHVFQPGPSDAAPTPVVADGDADAGRQVWVESCASCHGADAEGGIGPGFVGNTNLSDGDIAAVIQSGRGVMPAGLVSGQAEADVVAYLRRDVLGTPSP